MASVGHPRAFGSDPPTRLGLAWGSLQVTAAYSLQISRHRLGR